jgi:hypothetical protein
MDHGRVKLFVLAKGIRYDCRGEHAATNRVGPEFRAHPVIPLRSSRYLQDTAPDDDEGGRPQDHFSRADATWRLSRGVN